MLGKTGNGKSSTGNSIIGFKRYCSRSAFESVTFDCSWQSVRRFGVEVEVVDTPGFFDTEMAENKLKKEIVKCVGMASPGPHALLVTVRIDVRFTDEEADTIRKIRFAFGDHIMRHIIIIFTHGDALDDDESMEDRLRGSPAGLSNLLEETGARYVVFNNTKALPQDKKDEQVKKLLLKVGELLAATSNQHFSNPFLIRCHDNVMACAKQIAQILDGSSASETAQALLRACLESTDSAEELLHDLRDSNNVTSSQLKQLTDKLNAWEKGKADSDKQIRSLTKALRYAQKLMENLKQELEEEKKSWKMCILM
ncbi:uncharacterized protein [Littorina saxatilis]|uniref:uncharacterized protein n=1 Tax=Littorina saxatilis TaxID=31220 RepID=UPI0038B47161